MRRFVSGADRSQTTLFPACLDDWIDKNTPVRVIDAFAHALDLALPGQFEIKGHAEAPSAVRASDGRDEVLEQPANDGALYRRQARRRWRGW